MSWTPLKLLVLPALVAVLAACGVTDKGREGPRGEYRVYRGDGTGTSLEELLMASRAADVTVVGESHDDKIAHRLEHAILSETHQGNLALSLEMFETDTQLVLNEYLAGLIAENHFLEDARAWDNYEHAYRPLVEFAESEDLDVIAANAPRRYVNLVAREGPAALERLSERARRWLPPLPLDPPSSAYREKFLDLMTETMPSGAHPGDEQGESRQDAAEDVEAHRRDQHAGQDRLENSLAAQNLWDTTMAWSMDRYLREHPQARVLHITGSFHAEDGLGTVERLRNYRPGAEVLVVIIKPSEDFPAFEPAYEGLGDFVIVTPNAG